MVKQSLTSERNKICGTDLSYSSVKWIVYSEGKIAVVSNNVCVLFYQIVTLKTHIVVSGRMTSLVYTSIVENT